jgi:hypothetical protein
MPTKRLTCSFKRMNCVFKVELAVMTSLDLCVAEVMMSPTE